MTPSNDIIEVIWYRHPQVWFLAILCLGLFGALVWTLQSRSELERETIHQRQTVTELQQKIADALGETSKAASLNASRSATQVETIRARDERILELEREVTAAETRYRAAIDVADKETAARKAIEEQLASRPVPQSTQNTAVQATGQPPAFHSNWRRASAGSTFDINFCRQQGVASLLSAGVSGIQATPNYTIFGHVDAYRVMVLCFAADRLLVVLTVGPRRDVAESHTSRVVQELSRRV